MSQIIQKLDQQQLKSLCGIVAHTSEGLTNNDSKWCTDELLQYVAGNRIYHLNLSRPESHRSQ